MKLLVSDYDLTFNVLDYDVKSNVKAIDRFRENGNLFFLNTGRSYESIKKEVKKYNINYDYLGCCDGNLILNKNNEIIFCNNLSRLIFYEIDKLHDDFKFDIVNINYKGNILEYEVKTLENSLFESRLHEIALRNGLLINRFVEKRAINGKLQKVQLYFLYDKNISKSFATSYVSKLENIEKCDIFTIGDNHNDYEMIKDFNGYTFPWGKKKVKGVSEGTVLSVKGLVKKIMR